MNAVVEMFRQPRYFGIDPTIVETPKGPFYIGIERMSEVTADIAPLHKLHWDEVETGHTPLKMNVNYDNYAKFEDRGQFILFTVRTAQLRLIGYFMCYMHRANHALEELVAREDALFLHPDYRGGSVANHLLTYAEMTLKDMGCKTLSLSSRHHAGGVNLTPWLTRRKYKPSAVVFVKEL